MARNFLVQTCRRSFVLKWRSKHETSFWLLISSNTRNKARKMSGKLRQRVRELIEEKEWKELEDLLLNTEDEWIMEVRRRWGFVQKFCYCNFQSFAFSYWRLGYFCVFHVHMLLSSFVYCFSTQLARKNAIIQYLIYRVISVLPTLSLFTTSGNFTEYSRIIDCDIFGIKGFLSIFTIHIYQYYALHLLLGPRLWGNCGGICKYV